MPRQHTSVLAEQSLSLFDKQTQRAHIMAAITRSYVGMTDTELQEELNMSGDTERPRRGELLKAGLIKDSGVTRKTKRGREAIVWVVAS
jgi:hypothetical protein